MYNPKWDRWIYASVTKFFDTNKSNSLYDLFFEGHDYDENAFNASPKKVEFQLDGPKTGAGGTTADDYVLDYEINFIVTTIRNDQNLHAIYNITGHLQSIFKTKIPVYKYGDDDSLLGCLSLRSDISPNPKVYHFGQVEPKVPVLEALVIGYYRIYLENQ